MSRFVGCLACLLILAVCVLPVAAQGSGIPKADPAQKIYDYAEILTPEEEESLLALSFAQAQKTGADFAVLTLAEDPGMGVVAFCDGFYERNGLGYGSEYDGVMLYINMATRDVYLLTAGDVVAMFSENALGQIRLDVTEYLSAGRYYDASRVFFDRTGAHILDRQESAGLSAGEAAIIAVSVSFVLCLILVLIHRRSLPDRPGIHAYFDEKGLRLRRRDDVFVHTHTTRARLPKNDGGSSGGGAGAHRSSSGRSFGGSGGKF